MKELGDDNGQNGKGNDDARIRQQRADEAGPAEGEQQRQAGDGRRHDDRKLDKQADETLAAELVARQRISQRRTQDSRQANHGECGGEAEQYRGEYCRRIGQAFPGARTEPPGHQHGNRQRQKQEGEDADGNKEQLIRLQTAATDSLFPGLRIPPAASSVGSGVISPGESSDSIAGAQKPNSSRVDRASSDSRKSTKLAASIAFAESDNTAIG